MLKIEINLDFLNFLDENVCNLIIIWINKTISTIAFNHLIFLIKCKSNAIANGIIISKYNIIPNNITLFNFKNKLFFEKEITPIFL